MKTATRKTVTLREVAALAGIDKATASRALNGKGYVSAATLEAAQKAARELGFEPDLHAQRLAKGRSRNVIGLLATQDLGVATQQTSFLQHRLDELGFEVELHATPLYVRHSAERQVALVNKVRRQKPSAIIFETPLVPQALDELRLFIREGGFVVGYGHECDVECDQVVFDFEQRAYLATQHLLQLGHRELGFCFHGPMTQFDENLRGFRRALQERGLKVRDEWLFEGGNYEEGGFRLAQAFLSWSNRPTGICIINDVSAATFVNILARHGWQVPHDVSVVGFDDALAARYALVPLSSVSYPLQTIGKQVVDFVKSRFDGYQDAPRRTVIRAELVKRDSSAPLELPHTDRLSPMKVKAPELELSPIRQAVPR